MEITTLHDIAAAVRGRRQSLKLTQATLATKARVSRTFLADLEAGKLTVELRSVLAVLDALEFSLHLRTPGDSPLAGGSVGSPGDIDLDAVLDDYHQGRA